MSVSESKCVSGGANAIGFAMALGVFANSAAAQAPNTTTANVNVLNLLSPFLSLNSTSAGRATLNLNLANDITINNFAAAQPAAHEGLRYKHKKQLNERAGA